MIKVITTKQKLLKSQEIINYIQEYFNVNIFEKNRKRSIVVPRQMAMYYIRKKLGVTFERIGEMFNKDYSNVIHAVNKIADLIEFDKEVLEFHNEMKESIDLICSFNEKDMEKHLLIKNLKRKFEYLNLDELNDIKESINLNYFENDNERIKSVNVV